MDADAVEVVVVVVAVVVAAGVVGLVVGGNAAKLVVLGKGGRDWGVMATSML